jgi:hypothetical protein
MSLLRRRIPHHSKSCQAHGGDSPKVSSAQMWGLQEKNEDHASISQTHSSKPSKEAVKNLPALWNYVQKQPKSSLSHGISHSTI